MTPTLEQGLHVTTASRTAQRDQRKTHNLSQEAQANMVTSNMTSHSALSAQIPGLSSPLKPHNPILITGGNIQTNHNEGLSVHDLTSTP